MKFRFPAHVGWKYGGCSFNFLSANGFVQAMSTVTGLIDGTGSTGSAIGQFFVPLIQNSYGWTWIFYFFIIMVGKKFDIKLNSQLIRKFQNVLSALCLMRRFIRDIQIVWRSKLIRYQQQETQPLLNSQLKRSDAFQWVQLFFLYILDFISILF